MPETKSSSSQIETATSEDAQQSASDAVKQAINAIRNGGMVIMVDDEDRENEGDLVMAAQDVDTAAINFMVKHARGLICVPMEGHDIDRLRVPMMVQHNTSR